jgi:galactonate dehydratase
MTIRRRDLIHGLIPAGLLRGVARPSLKITGLEVFFVSVNERGNWVFVRLNTDKGLAGLGEPSHGILSRSAEAVRAMRGSIGEFFELVRGSSPFDIEEFRRRAWAKARAGGRRTATAFSGIEHAMWDLAGKALGVPVYDVLGGKVRGEIDCYANINRATDGDRSPNAFAENARRAVAAGFRTIKAAPFDGMPRPGSPRAAIDKAKELGIACVEEMRKAVGPKIGIYIDCHSHFDREMAIEVARRLEPVNLAWYEEPVQPARIGDMIAIGKAIQQKLSGGEALFGAEAFAPLLRSRALRFVMPDVKHCGGILEARRIAAMAEVDGVLISPHNPSGPVATAVSVQVCAGIQNFALLEHAWGEVPWSKDLITPPEEFRNGALRVPDAPGLGIELNERVLKAHLV